MALQIGHRVTVFVILEDGYYYLEENGWMYGLKEEINEALEKIAAEHRADEGVRSINVV